MDKVYSILNICGISGRCYQNLYWYLDVLKSILTQRAHTYEHRVVVSACCSNIEVLKIINNVYPDVKIILITDQIPVNPSFNYSVVKCIERFGPATWYNYIDSGIKFTNEWELERLVELARSGPYSMISCLTDDDSGADQWFNDSLPGGDYFLMPIGKALNLHVALFSESWRSYYNRLLPDIFAGHCSESVLSFIAAAIKTNWVVSKKVIVSHKRDVDGQSSGFDPAKWVGEGKNRLDHPFIIDSVITRIMGIFPWGGGYEGRYVKHNADHYDENGFCKNNILKVAIKENLFLQPHEFDYNKVNAQWL